ncbi:MAG: RNA polymerase sigma factor [Mycobacteriales bacterium]|nr:MAG: SigE family RNA polymerase sigma factor [Pseudonocardiales bacterium]
MFYDMTSSTGRAAEHVEDTQCARFIAFYEHTCARLIGQVATMIGSRTDAEDIVQDAFVRCLSNWSKVRDYDNPEAWVRTVAFRLCTSRYRRTIVAARALPRLLAPTDTYPAESVEDRLDIEAALAKLDIFRRAVLILYYTEDLSIEEIARTLNIRPGTVKSRLARARSQLQTLLSDDTGGKANE